MRSTIVPAQVTTVEDKITGKLGLSQLLLLTIPVFGGSLLYVLLPPFFDYAVYKIVLLSLLAALSGLLAIRIKGKILFSWVVAIVQYNLRPRYYVYNKNDMHKRQTPAKPIVQHRPIKERVQKIAQPHMPKLSTAERVRIEDILTNPQANVHFKTNRKGELSVHFTEVQ